MSTGLARIEHSHGFNEMVSISEVVAKSQLFKMSQPQILTLMLLCESEGLHPIRALQLYDIIDGKPSLKAVALLARFLESGGSVEWREQSSQAAEATFTHPKTCPKGVLIRYTIDDAKLAGLAAKDNWRKNPSDMLVARVCSRGVKRANPACILGMELPEYDEAPATVEQSARDSIVEQLAARRESPRNGHAPVAETVAELKAAEEPKPARPEVEPSTEWGKVIAEATAEANKALAEMADANPGRIGLRKSLKVQEVVNGVVKMYVATGVLSEESLKTDGKRDSRKVAAAIQLLWNDDRGDVEGAVAKYIGRKITEAMGPTEAAEAELASA